MMAQSESYLSEISMDDVFAGSGKRPVTLDDFLSVAIRRTDRAWDTLSGESDRQGSRFSKRTESLSEGRSSISQSRIFETIAKSLTNIVAGIESISRRATTKWKTSLGSSAIGWIGAELASELNLGGYDPGAKRKLLVKCESDPERYGVLILSDNVRRAHALSPREILSDDQVNNLLAARDRITDNFEGSLSSLSDVLRSLNPREIKNLISHARPAVVIAQMPKMMALACPWPPFDVDTHGGKQSTVGTLVSDGDGRVGVTAAYHATGPVGTKVRIGANTCEVALACEINDIVFIPLPPGVNFPELRGRRGPLRKRPPWETEEGSFYGRTSGERRTKVVGMDKGLPTSRPGRQLCVQTRPDTDEGDSGAALINDSDEIVGFAFQRTAWGEEPAFTDWIWAAAAWDALGLKPMQP